MSVFFCSVSFKGDQEEVDFVRDNVMSLVEVNEEDYIRPTRIAGVERRTKIGDIFLTRLYTISSSIPWAQVHGAFKNHMPKEQRNRLRITLSSDPVLWQSVEYQYFIIIFFY